MNKVFKTLIISVIVNVFLSFTKIIFGVIYYSQALITDGFHSLSDLITDIVGLIGNKLAHKPADNNHPYGHGRIEYVTGIIIGIVIFFLGVTLFIDNIYQPHYIPNGIIIVVIIFTIVVKYLLSRYIINQGRKYNNNILIASGSESRMDVLSSVVVLLSFLGSKLSSISNVFVYSDKVGSVIVSILIIKVAVDILRENVTSVIGEGVDDLELLNQIKKIIRKSSKKIKNIDQINLLKYGSYYKAVIDLSIDCDISFLESHAITRKVKTNLLYKMAAIKYITVHVNAYKE